MSKLFAVLPHGLIAVVAVLFSALLYSSFPAYARQQIHHSNPLCQDYIVIKLQDYLDITSSVDFDEYRRYKQELIDYCNRMVACRLDNISNDYYDQEPSPYQPSSGIGNYKLNLD